MTTIEAILKHADITRHYPFVGLSNGVYQCLVCGFMVAPKSMESLYPWKHRVEYVDEV